MNKKEQAYVEELKTKIALRWTADMQPDVEVPKNGLAKGFLFAGARSDSARVDVACSNAIGHSFGKDDRTTTQGARKLYSSRLAALMALRYAVEEACAARLRNVDRMIEEEKNRSEP